MAEYDPYGSPKPIEQTVRHQVGDEDGLNLYLEGKHEYIADSEFHRYEAGFGTGLRWEQECFAWDGPAGRTSVYTTPHGGGFDAQITLLRGSTDETPQNSADNHPSGETDVKAFDLSLKTYSGDDRTEVGIGVGIAGGEWYVGGDGEKIDPDAAVSAQFGAGWSGGLGISMPHGEDTDGDGRGEWGLHIDGAVFSGEPLRARNRLRQPGKFQTERRRDRHRLGRAGQRHLAGRIL